MVLSEMSEKLLKWELDNQLIGNYYLESITDDSNGLRLNLSKSENKKIKVIILFEQRAISFKYSYESFRLKLLDELHETFKEVDYTNWSFYKINNSKYLTWLSEESETITNSLKLTHYCIYCLDSIIDIIVWYEPVIKIENI